MTHTYTYTFIAATFFWPFQCCTESSSYYHPHRCSFVLDLTCYLRQCTTEPSTNRVYDYLGGCLCDPMYSRHTNLSPLFVIV